MTGPRPMYDAIGGQSRDPQAIAAKFGTQVLVAGYVDGLYAWTAAQWAVFPSANRIRITAIPGSATAKDADVADCEFGDYTPLQAGQWVVAAHEDGERKTVYCSRDTIPEVRAAAGSLQLNRDYDIWAADWTGAPHVVDAPPPGPVLPCATTQYQPDYLGICDLDMVYDPGWPHRGGPPPPPSEVTVNVTLPVLAQGATDPIGTDNIVHRLQGLLVGIGRAWGDVTLVQLVIDGIYGPATRAAVQIVQRAFGLSDDGIVGAQTWPPLLTGR